MPERYFTIQDWTDPEPWALLRVNRGLYERWVPDNGWVDTPYFAAYFNGGEMGAREVTAAEAEELQKAGIGSAGAENAEIMRGKP